MKVRKRKTNNSTDETPDEIKHDRNEHLTPTSSNSSSIVPLVCLICGIVIGITISTLYYNITQRSPRINNAQHNEVIKNEEKGQGHAQAESQGHRPSEGHSLSEGQGDAVVGHAGGWRLADNETLQFLYTSRCNIDRRYIHQLTDQKFESEFRFKKPVIIRFPKGAKDWTDPSKWTLQALRQTYGDWEVVSGTSDDIVRKGGRGDHSNSFQDYVNTIMNDKLNTREPQYVFDRDFYDYTALSETLNLPNFLKVQPDKEDSIFFLGGSRSGVSFHKHADAWNGVIYGRKRWFIYLVQQAPPGGVWPGYTTLEWYRRVYPNLTESTLPLECIQEPGDILYLPESAYHATLNLGDTVALGIQKQQTSTEIEQYFYKVFHEVEGIIAEGKPGKKYEVAKRKQLEYFLALEKLIPNNAEVQMKLGAAYEVARDMENALYHTRKAIEIDPFFIVAQINLANFLKKKGDVEEADTVFRRASYLSPNNWEVIGQYGDFLVKQERFREAVTVFKKGTQVRPEMIQFWYRLMKAQSEIGDQHGAAASQRQLQILEESQGEDDEE